MWWSAAAMAAVGVVLLAQTSVDARLAKWKPVQVPFRSSGLSTKEVQMVNKLVEATKLLDELYWRQSDPEGYKLSRSTGDAKLKRLLAIMGGRWDLADDNRPFAGAKM